MSKKLPTDPEQWTEDDLAYARQRPWIRVPEDVVESEPEETPEGEPEGEPEDLTEAMVRNMSKGEVLALFEDEALAEDLAGVDKFLNKEPLIEAVVTALFEEN